jgi:hypothetical protein
VRLEEAIVTQLKNHTPLAALVGTRIYPITYPQNATLPVVTYQRTAKTPEYSHDGEAGVAESRFQISSFATSFAQVRDVASAVKGALRPWMAGAGGEFDGKRTTVFLESEFDMYTAEDAEQLAAYHVLGDYLFVCTMEDD